MYKDTFTKYLCMKTGIVVNNYDPKCKNRCQIRVHGIHTQTVNGQYVIIDDDRPWALPAPNPSYNGGYYSVPNVGDRVYVDVKDNYNIVYYGNVEIHGNVKKMLNDNADASDRVKVIAFSEDKNDDGTTDYMKIYYLPEKGLTIECNGNLISLPKYNSLEIKTKGGAGISIDIISNVKKKYNLFIGNKTAEVIKVNLATAVAPEEGAIQTIKVFGRDVVSGLPTEKEIDSSFVYEAIREHLHNIVDSVKIILEHTPPEIASDIIDSGIYVTGGSAKIHNLKELLSTETELDINICEDSANTVALGLGKIIENPEYDSLAYVLKQATYKD